MNMLCKKNVQVCLGCLLAVSLIVFTLSGCSLFKKAPQKISFVNHRPAVHATAISEKMEYWTTQRKGSNVLLNQYRPNYFSEARKAGIEYIRFGPNLLPANDKDFLIGDLDNFTTINIIDLSLLIKILDDAYENDIGIILTMFALPGHRYGNPNEVETDTRLWEEEKYWIQSFDFWKQLVAEVKDHPAIVAYNPINEPVAAYAYGFEGPGIRFGNWLKRTKGTAADLNLFNQLMVESIREIDLNTPIVLDGYFWTDPKGLPSMEAVDDPNILYAFHNPAPWNFAALEGNKGRYVYPDAMPAGSNGKTESWTIDDLENLLLPVHQFMEEQQIPAYQIIASEFWCNRRVHGCAEYFRDLIRLYDKNDWHWGFWDFRSDGAWTGLDYQLGDTPESGKYIVGVNYRHKDPETLKERDNNPIWNTLYKGLNGTYLELSENETTRHAHGDITTSISHLQDEEWLVRETAALNIARIGPAASSAIPSLLELLEDEEWLVRRSSVYALSLIGSSEDDDLRKAIEDMQNDPEEHVRIEAALALWKLRDR